jgi:hypothetical protein
MFMVSVELVRTIHKPVGITDNTVRRLRTPSDNGPQRKKLDNYTVYTGRSSDLAGRSSDLASGEPNSLERTSCSNIFIGKTVFYVQKTASRNLKSDAIVDCLFVSSFESVSKKRQAFLDDSPLRTLHNRNISC